ncbi:MAG: hypothetical protein ACLVHV_02575 [Oscillospiraceae bacterium]
MGLIVIILVILILSFAFVVRNYYYNGIQSTIQGHVSGISSYFSGSLDDYSRFNATAVNYVETFSDKEQMELMAFDRHDRSLITSTGFEVDQKQAMPDYELAKSSGEGAAIWTGTLNSGEKVIGDYTGRCAAPPETIWAPCGMWFPWNRRTEKYLCRSACCFWWAVW